MKKNKTILVILGIIIYFLFIYILNLKIEINNIKVIGLTCIALIIFIADYFVLKDYKITKKMNYKKIMIAIVCIGIVLRTAYILYTPIERRQHDMEENVGHLAYIENIYETGNLPEHNKWQFYQQPLHHIISAIWLKVNIACGIDLQEAEEGIQFLTAIYSSLIMIITYCILRELKIEDKFKILIMAVISAHPTFILLSGSINNDILMIMFTFFSLLYLIKWNKNPDIKNTIILAFSVALGALSKISSTIIAVPIIYVFINRFIKDYSEKSDYKKIIKDYATKFIIFGIIALGIGLLFSARNMVKFGQSIFYVPNPSMAVYRGYKKWFDRVNIFSDEWLKTYCHPFRDCNIFAYVIKSSLFGEFNADNFESFALENSLLVCNIILIVFSIIALLKIMIKKENKDENIKMFIIFWITEIIMFAYGNITKPYACTMDFRYIVPTILTGMIFISTALKNSKQFNYKIALSVTILFVILSMSFVLTDMSLLTI